MRTEQTPVNKAHYLMGCRLDNWLHLLWQNKFRIAPEKRNQALAITAGSVALAIPALIEGLIMAPILACTKLKRDPVFIIGHWRSGTTYLQNIMSRDSQFGWADPVSTSTMPNCVLLRPLLSRIIGPRLTTARPMDNLKYELDLPMEETFALLTVSTLSIIHMLSFPISYERYLAGAFVDDMSPAGQRRWKNCYSRVLRKLSLVKGGRQLLLKSPDNTAHMRQLLELYPDARFVNICRDPYTTIQSSIHMFKKQMEQLRISPMPDFDLDETLENVFLQVFERMYRDLFELEKKIPKNRMITVKYEDFCAAPVEKLREIYGTLEIGGFESAEEAFVKYADSQKNYVKNKFTLSDSLREKINGSLGFYFEHCGYEMEL